MMEATTLQSSFLSPCVGTTTFSGLSISEPKVAVAPAIPYARRQNVIATRASTEGLAFQSNSPSRRPAWQTANPRRRERRKTRRSSSAATPAFSSDTKSRGTKDEANGAAQNGGGVSVFNVDSSTTLFSFGEEPDADDGHDSSDSEGKLGKSSARKEKPVESSNENPKEEIVAIKEKVSILESEVEAERKRAKVLKDQVVALSKEKTQSVVKEEAIKVAERAAAAVLACPLGEDIHENEGLMPPHRQDGLLADVSGLKMETMVLADAVYNKELSWLAFNWRVLYMAVMPATPIFERLRFLAITARNLDEFFGKRVGGLKRQAAAGTENLIGERRELMWSPNQQLKFVTKEVATMVDVQINTLLKEVMPELAKQGIRLMDYADLDHTQKSKLRKFFRSALEPVLTPLAVDPGHPFPFIGNMTLSIAVTLKDPVDEDTEFAIVNVPTGIDRFMRLADDENLALRNTFVCLEQIIIANLGELFGGMEIVAAHAFRVTRNADVARNEEEAEDLLEMITDEMRERKFAPFVRLEVDCEMPTDMVDRLTEELQLVRDDVYRICGPMALGELDSIPVQFGVQFGMDSSLQFPQWSPLTHIRLAGGDIFDTIRRGDVLVHHPYHSFATSTQHFVETAARDPKVVAIKATLYRTNSDSPVIRALEKAAEFGKQVAVLVELKARFDEARNVGFAQKLEDAGCNVAYGLVGLKTHCKCTMVVRQEETGLRTYCHIGTGNYNPRTAGIYTDFGMFTCDPALGQDVADLFKYLTGYHRQKAYRKLLVAPGTMRREFVRLIDREIENARAGLPSGMVVKCNGLDDQVMIAKVYEASNAGVKVDCIVRGICGVRPGFKGISENIRVISIIGRFLEHHRIFRFENGGKPEFYIGSADWMTRNLMRRVEVVTPVIDESIKKELQDIIEACLCDRVGAWEMQPDGRYQLLGVGKGAEIPRAVIPDPGNRLAPRAEHIGFQGALMELAQRQSRKAKKVDFKKKDGRVQRPRRYEVFEEH